MSPRYLVLWDVDHTLIETRGVGTALFGEAFTRVTGVPMRELIKIPGLTEPDVLHRMLRLHDLTPTEQIFARFAYELTALHEERIDLLRTRGRMLPGVERTLAELAGHPEVAQSVLTGNLRGVAAVKLDAFGLTRWVDLDAGAYGSDHRERAALVGIARARAADRYGRDFPGPATVIVGDTPADVRTARTAGAAVVAVATGKSGAAELAATAPDQLLSDLAAVSPFFPVVAGAARAAMSGERTGELPDGRVRA
ncbi:HAD family hydrolase [Plantactinospora sonchi]|uniref:Haloacid dehalogenase-like hydrolase n=1 Tax=Plantactinospora sonchi TaxID=1544735 RepID=A0ABU7S3P5_9ACTN